MRNRISPATIIASVALFFSLGSVGVAARRYIITSVSQIKPSVSQQLLRRVEVENSHLRSRLEIVDYEVKSLFSHITSQNTFDNERYAGLVLSIRALGQIVRGLTPPATG